MRPSTIATFVTLSSARRRTHFGALLPQDGLARQLDAIAFDRQYLYQNLIALVQFVTNVFDAVFGDLADV
jgi:hypothetical protein